MTVERRTTSQSAVWKSTFASNMIPEANNQGVSMYTYRGPQRAPELPATAWWILMEKLQRWQREEDDEG